MNRPRRRERKGWPDYLNVRAKPKGDYYSWKHPVTGKEYALGYSLKEAIAQALAANLQLRTEQTSKLALTDRISGTASVLFSDWLVTFKGILDKRPSKKKGGGMRAEGTRKIDDSKIAVLKEHFKDSVIDKITTKECAELIQKYQDSGHENAAYVYRSFMIDCFDEAEAAGLIPRGTNPASITKANPPKTQRVRLTEEGFKKILDASDGWIKTAMLLALITGQRVGDIARMQYADVERGFLKVIQEKTGARIRIPVELELLGHSLKDVIKQSRRIVGAKTIVHQTVVARKSKPGDAMAKATIANVFAKLVDEQLGTKWEGTRPTFHEIRALSKRMHKANGIDTLTLLGHDSDTTARIYDDPRAGWVDVSIPSSMQDIEQVIEQIIERSRKPL